MKSQLVAALGTDPELFRQLDLDDIQRRFHAGPILVGSKLFCPHLFRAVDAGPAGDISDMAAAVGADHFSFLLRLFSFG